MNTAFLRSKILLGKVRGLLCLPGFNCMLLLYSVCLSVDSLNPSLCIANHHQHGHLDNFAHSLFGLTGSGTEVSSMIILLIHEY